MDDKYFSFTLLNHQIHKLLFFFLIIYRNLLFCWTIHEVNLPMQFVDRRVKGPKMMVKLAIESLVWNFEP